MAQKSNKQYTVKQQIWIAICGIVLGLILLYEAGSDFGLYGASQVTCGIQTAVIGSQSTGCDHRFVFQLSGLFEALVGIAFLFSGIYYTFHVPQTSVKKSALDQSIKEDPQNAESYYKRAQIWRDRNENDKAIDDLSKVIELDPNNLSALYDRGALYVAKAAWDNALSDYSTVLKHAPYKAHVYNNRAVVYERMHEYKKALADYEKAVSLAPSKTLYKQNLAKAKATLNIKS